MFSSMADDLNMGKGTDTIYLDFCKAFDSVSHSHLLYKLHHCGIRGKLFLWLKSCLTNRRQICMVACCVGCTTRNDMLPNLRERHFGILQHQRQTFRQGSKLFNNNTNRTECQDLQYDLNALSGCSKTLYGMVFIYSTSLYINYNASKCAVLRIKPKTSFTYSLNNTPLKSEKKQKDMRIIVSNYLKPRKHVLGVCTKANRISRLVKRCFTKLDKNKISTLYKSIVRPILAYGYVVWSPWTVHDKQALEREQRRFLGLANDDISLPRWSVEETTQIYPKHTHS